MEEETESVLASAHFVSRSAWLPAKTRSTHLLLVDEKGRSGRSRLKSWMGLDDATVEILGLSCVDECARPPAQDPLVLPNANSGREPASGRSNSAVERPVWGKGTVVILDDTFFGPEGWIAFGQSDRQSRCRCASLVRWIRTQSPLLIPGLKPSLCGLVRLGAVATAGLEVGQFCWRVRGNSVIL